MYSVDTTIAGPSRGDPEVIYQWAKKKGCARPDDVRLYLTTLSKLCRSNNLRFEVLVSQSIHETTEDGIPWNSYWLRTRMNVAGIGITGDPAQNAESRDFKTGDAAARAQFLHVYLYAVGRDIPTGLSKSDDPRYDAALSAGYAGIAPTLAGFTNRYGIDSNYANAWLGRLNALEAAGLLSGEPAKETTVSDTVDNIVDIVKNVTTPKALVFGKVEPFGYIDKYLANKQEGYGWDNLGKRNPKFIALHRMWGTMAGTLSFFSDPSVGAMTDYAVAVEGVDGKAMAGIIYRYNDPYGYRSGWASGPVSAPFGDGAAFVNKYGVNAVNRDGISIEISGYDNDPMDAVSWQELVHFIGYFADQCKVPWETFPLNPATGISFVIWHTEFTKGTGKACPFTWVRNNTDRLIADVKTFLQGYQTGSTTTPDKPAPPIEKPTTPVPAPQYATPQPVPALAKLGKQDKDTAKALVIDGATRFTFVNDRVRATKDTKRLQYANVGAQVVGPDIKAGEEFDVLWQFTDEDSKEWYLTPWNTRVLQSDTERIKD